MQRIILYISIAIMSISTKLIAQETKSFEQQAKEIAKNIRTIAQEEKKALKEEVEAIDKAVQNGTMTKEQAEKTKAKIAEERAKNIETKIATEEEKLRELINGNLDLKATDSTPNYEVTLNTPLTFKNNKKKIKLGEKRTTSQFVFATGFNNLVTNGAIANSDFGYLRSTFYEGGVTWNTRLSNNSNLLHLKYGLSFQYNLLHATDNRIFEDIGDQTILTTYPIDLKDNTTYFKNVYFVLPVHLEFDFSKTNEKDGKKIFKSHKAARFGIGGFVGVNTNSKQFLRYEIDGKKIKERTKADFNVNDFTYGLSAYVGYKQTSLYLKYDLNPMFKNNAIDQNNISLGIRFDWN